MKKKNQAPHDEIKGYLQVAQERIAQALFTRPEWRHPKNVAGVNVIIGRINEVYYPFSDRKTPKAAVWKQVLREKREEMIEALEKISIKTRKEELIAEGFGAAKALGRFIPPSVPPANTGAKETNHVVVNNSGNIDANKVVDAFRANLPWTKERIAKLRDEIKGARAGSMIAREVKASPSLIGAVLDGKKGLSLKTRYIWLLKIEIALNLIKSNYPEKFQSSALKAVKTKIHPGDMVIQNEKGELISKQKDDSPRDHSLFDFPLRGNSLISNMSIDIKDGKLHVHVVVDADAAFGMYKERQLSVSKDEIKFSIV